MNVMGGLIEEIEELEIIIHYYVSYCCSLRKKLVKNEFRNIEICKEYVEEDVFSEFERKIFNDEAKTYLTEGINNNIKIKKVSKVITEADARALLSDFSGYLESRNIS